MIAAIGKMSESALGARMWALGYSCLAVAYAINVFVSSEWNPARGFTYNTMLIAGHTWLLAGTWQFMNKPLPTRTISLLFISIFISTVIFTFLFPIRDVRLVTIGIWLIMVRASFAYCLWQYANNNRYERTISRVAASLVLVEVLATLIYTTNGALGELPLIGKQSGTVAVITWLGALIGIMVGAPILMLLSTSRFIAELDKAAHHDPLTSLYNRRGFFYVIRPLLTIGARQHNNIHVLMIDIDNFKQLNDTHGHSVGDHVLEIAGETLATTVRESDAVARWGGEEFCILTYAMHTDNTIKLAERIRTLFTEKCALLPELQNDVVTISIGVSINGRDGESFDAIQSRADKALYTAKKTGRNKTILYSE
ncbi:diguanylate cyclase [Pseudoalteromonas sp. MSK9-3]|uniref:GGDEF domain-containing protein n=1 Tax=Pseudoalteromonas sp. MSK9-3 TaxID=1897633 RepID=UPI0015FF7DA7|nr:GGDEF domain-containing protein [Pseudoalteromonas sp. MSK9-3]